MTCISRTCPRRKMEKKTRWIQANSHALRTGDVPSLLPLVYDLPMGLLGGNYGAQHKHSKDKRGAQSMPVYIETFGNFTTPTSQW